MAKKEMTIEEKTKKLQDELKQAEIAEQKEVEQKIIAILNEKGYTISARIILENGQLPQAQTFIVKVK